MIIMICIHTNTLSYSLVVVDNTYAKIPGSRIPYDLFQFIHNVRDPFGKFVILTSAVLIFRAEGEHIGGQIICRTRIAFRHH